MPSGPDLVDAVVVHLHVRVVPEDGVDAHQPDHLAVLLREEPGKYDMTVVNGKVLIELGIRVEFPSRYCINTHCIVL